MPCKNVSLRYNLIPFFRSADYAPNSRIVNKQTYKLIGKLQKGSKSPVSLHSIKYVQCFIITVSYNSACILQDIYMQAPPAMIFYPSV